MPPTQSQTQQIRSKSPSLHAATMRADYNAHSKLQRSSVDSSKPFIEKGVEAYRGPVANVVTIADFGSSVGANSSHAISIFLEILRKKYHSTPVIVVHNDLPSNSWSTMFDYLNNDPESYVQNYENVFSAASGQSFYKQILPSNSLHFGYSNMALQWLSELPVKLTKHCFPMTSTSTNEELALFKLTADRDWRCFLEARRNELVKGGVLVIHCPVKKDNLPPEEMWQKGRLAADALYRAAKRLVDEHSLLTEEELLNFNIPVYIRDYSEITDPGLLGSFGFEIVSVEMLELCQNPNYNNYLVHKEVEKFADDTCCAMAAGIEPTFLQALSNTRSNEEKKAICRAFWQEYRHLIMEYPDEFDISGCGVYFVLRKK